MVWRSLLVWCLSLPALACGQMTAVKSATSVSARMLGKETQIGSLAKGRLADLIGVRGRPDHDLSKLENVEFVMKDGLVIKNEFATDSDLQAHE